MQILISTPNQSFELDFDSKMGHNSREDLYLMPSKYHPLSDCEMKMLKWIFNTDKFRYLTSRLAVTRLNLVKYDSNAPEHLLYQRDGIISYLNPQRYTNGQIYYALSSQLLAQVKLYWQGWTSKLKGLEKDLTMLLLMGHQVRFNREWQTLLEILGFNSIQLSKSTAELNIATFGQWNGVLDTTVWKTKRVHNGKIFYWLPVKLLADDGRLIPSLLTLKPLWNKQSGFQIDQSVEPIPQELVPSFRRTYHNLSGTASQIGAKIVSLYLLYGKRGKLLFQGSNSYHQTEWIYRSVRKLLSAGNRLI